jgi:hypothetical protein
VIATPAIDFRTIDALTDGKLGRHDVACPLCGPCRHSPLNQRRPVLRVWRPEFGFASFHCARCDEHGYVHDRSTARPRPDRRVIEQIKIETVDRERIVVAERLAKARWLWARHIPIVNSIAETYLRTARGYGGPLPSTLGYLPPRGDHGPAMIAAFGFPNEPEPGELHLDYGAVRSVHITRLALDGSGKAGTTADKIMIGRVRGTPIVLAPVNDLGGLAITEGIEDGLSVFEATGLGVWVAGSGGFMPALAEYVPAYFECVTIFSHDDEAGQAGARKLAEALQARGLVDVSVEGLR